MIRTGRSSPRSSSHTGFVLIRGSTGHERRTSWEWLTQRNLKAMGDREEENRQPRLSYSEKKRILSGLDYPHRPSSNFKVRAGFNLRDKKRVSSTASCASLNT